MNKKYSETGEQILNLLEKADKFQDWLYSELKPYLQGNILEIGSGKGSYSRKIISDFPASKIILSDIDQSLVNGLKEEFENSENVSFLQADISSSDDLEKISGQINSALAINVLEHVENDVSALRNVYKILENGGKFIVLVPAHKSLFNSIDQSVGHYRRYTREEFEKKAKEAGFKINKIFYFNFFSILGWFVSGNILKKKDIDEKYLKSFNFLVPLIKFFENKILRKKMGISLVAILEK